MEDCSSLVRGETEDSSLPPISLEAQLALTRIRNLSTCLSPSQNTFQLQSDKDFQGLQRYLRADVKLWQYLEENGRIDYSGRSRQLTIREPSRQAESFCALLGNEINDSLRGIAAEEPQHRIFIASIYDDGNAACSYNGSRGLYRWEHSPDSQYRYKSNVWPAVIIEVAYLQPEKQLEELAKDYISGSDGRVKLVITLNIEYEAKMVRGDFSIWRPIWKVSEKGTKMLSLNYSQGVFCETGKPIGDGIPLNLSDFSFNSPKTMNIPFNISSESLTRFVLDAEIGTIRRGSLHPGRKFSIKEPMLVLERSSSMEDV